MIGIHPKIIALHIADTTASAGCRKKRRARAVLISIALIALALLVFGRGVAGVVV